MATTDSLHFLQSKKDADVSAFVDVISKLNLGEAGDKLSRVIEEFEEVKGKLVIETEALRVSETERKELCDKLDDVHSHHHHGIAASSIDSTSSVLTQY